MDKQVTIYELFSRFDCSLRRNMRYTTVQLDLDKQVTTCKLFSWVVSASNSLSCAWDAKSSHLDVKGGNFAFWRHFYFLAEDTF